MIALGARMTLNQHRFPQIPLPCSPSNVQCFTYYVSSRRRGEYYLQRNMGLIIRAVFSPASNDPTAQTATWPDEAFDFAPVGQVPFSHNLAHNSSLPLVCAIAGGHDQNWRPWSRPSNKS